MNVDMVYDSAIDVGGWVDDSAAERGGAETWEDRPL